MDLEPAVLERVRPWEPRFAPRETVLAPVRCLLKRKPGMGLKLEVGPQQHCPRVLLHGAHADAMSGGIRAAATTQPADEGGEEPVGG